LARVDEVKVALPLLAVPVPRVTDPSLNVTVPVAVEGRCAVNVTEAPNVDGLREDETVIVGVALLMTKLPAAAPARLL
jgi:hypothetical protein